MSARDGTIRFGICGMGLMGRGFYRILREHPRAAVTAICDIDVARLEPGWYAAAHQGTASAADDDRVLQLGGKAGAPSAPVQAFRDFEELAACPDVDAVAVTTPTTVHPDASIAALRRGKHVICEKPMALSAAECDRMLAAARTGGATLMIEQCVRFFPQYELIKRYVEEGRLGRVSYASLQRLASPPSHSRQDWMLDGRQSGGALFDLHVHDVDFAQQLLGVPRRIYARGSRGQSGGIDHVSAAWTFDSGAYALVEGGWSLHAPWPFDMAITVRGERATMHWTASRGNDVLLYEGGAEPRRLPCPAEGGTPRLIHYFVDCLVAGAPVARCTAESARLSIALTEVEQRSLETGSVVEIEAALRA